jgi:pyridoxamine-phosphate oxidase
MSGPDSQYKPGGTVSSHAATLSGDASLLLPEFSTPPDDPIALLQAWIEEAVQHQVREPLAVTLASANAEGRVSSRVVLLKEVAEAGLLFGSHRASRKGRDFAVQPWGSVTFYWRETLQQVNLAGPVIQLSDAESDQLFQARLPAAQATTAASEQSQPLTDESALRARAAELAAAQGPLTRPPGWGGYRLVPQEIEFWHGSPDRLHRRLRYDRESDHQWTSIRLQP